MRDLVNQSFFREWEYQFYFVVKDHNLHYYDYNQEWAEIFIIKCLIYKLVCSN